MSSIEELAKRLGRIERALERGSVSQLGRSSFDGAIRQYTEDGAVLLGQYGEQYDGTSGAVMLNGPTPPQPIAATLTPALGGFEVQVSGGFVPDGSGSTVVAPMDFRNFTIHLGLTESFTPTRETGRFTIPSAAGGSVFVTATTENEWYVKVVCISEAGVLSAPSIAAGPVRAQGVTAEDLAFDPADFAGTTIHYGPVGTPPAAEDIGGVGDVWLAETAAGPPAKYSIRRWDGDSWEELLDQGAADSLAAALAAQQAAALKARILNQPNEPTGLTATDKVVWIETDAGNRIRSWNGTGWDDLRLGSGAIQPQGLIASDVIATGTITAALLQAILVLSTQVVAGDPNGVHVRMTPTGFRVYRLDPGTGLPEEVARLGTDTNDYFGIVDTDGLLVASIDDTGVGNFRKVNALEDFTLRGRTIESFIDESNQPTGSYRVTLPATAPPSGYGPIRFRVGMVEVNGKLIAGHRYRISWQCHWTAELTNGEADFALHVRSSTTDTAAAPLASDTALENWVWACPSANQWHIAHGVHYFTATVTGRHRFLLSLARGLDFGGGYSVYGIADNRFPVSIDFEDLGTAKPYTGQVSAGNGTMYNSTPPAPPAAPTQQYDTGHLAPAGWKSYRGNGTERTDVTGPVQGYDPSGFNGDGGGFWWFNLPSITGTVNYVAVYLYSSHWYYNSGGTARVSMIPAGVTSNYVTARQGQLDVGGFTKPGGKWFELPSGWWPYFSNAGANGQPRMIGVSVGPSGGSNLAYYGKFDGPAARMRIIYTQ